MLVPTGKEAGCVPELAIQGGAKKYSWPSWIKAVVVQLCSQPLY